MSDSGGVIGETPRLVKAEFDRSPESFRALSDWASDLYAPSLAGDYSDFRVSLHCLNVGSGVLMDWQSAPIQLDRSPAHIARGNLELYRIMINLAGDQHLTFGSKNISLRTGDIHIFDTTVPERRILTVPEAGTMAHAISLHVPRARVAPLLRNPDSVHAAVIRGDSTFGRFVSDHFLSIWRNASLLTTAENDAAAQSLITLVAGGVGLAAGAEESVVRETRRAALATIKRHIDSQLGTSELNGDALCRRFGLSRATLARLFEPEGGLTRYVQQRRLHRAFVMLGSAAYRHWRIIDVALECNFSSDATFTRAFRQTFGLTPGNVRQMVHGDVQIGRGSTMTSGQGFLPWIHQLDARASRLGA